MMFGQLYQEGTASCDSFPFFIMVPLAGWPLVRLEFDKHESAPQIWQFQERRWPFYVAQLRIPFFPLASGFCFSSRLANFSVTAISFRMDE